MKNHSSVGVRNGLVLVCLSLGLHVADLQATEKPKVISGSELSTDNLVDALDIGDAAGLKDDTTTRGMRPVLPPSSRSNQDASGGQGAAGKAPLLITFKTGSTELTSEGKSMLSRVAEALQSDRLVGFSFVVEGHADPRGNEVHNVKLSQGRADSVVRYLATQHGVPAARLKPVGRGSAELYDTVRTDAPENRRVTLVTQRPR